MPSIIKKNLHKIPEERLPKLLELGPEDEEEIRNILEEGLALWTRSDMFGAAQRFEDYGELAYRDTEGRVNRVGQSEWFRTCAARFGEAERPGLAAKFRGHAHWVHGRYERAAEEYMRFLVEGDFPTDEDRTAEAMSFVGPLTEAGQRDIAQRFLEFSQTGEIRDIPIPRRAPRVVVEEEPPRPPARREAPPEPGPPGALPPPGPVLDEGFPEPPPGPPGAAAPVRREEDEEGWVVERDELQVALDEGRYRDALDIADGPRREGRHEEALRDYDRITAVDGVDEDVLRFVYQGSGMAHEALASENSENPDVVAQHTRLAIDSYTRGARLGNQYCLFRSVHLLSENNRHEEVVGLWESAPGMQQLGDLMPSEQTEVLQRVGSAYRDTIREHPERLDSAIELYTRDVIEHADEWSLNQAVHLLNAAGRTEDLINLWETHVSRGTTYGTRPNTKEDIPQIQLDIMSGERLGIWTTVGDAYLNTRGRDAAIAHYEEMIRLRGLAGLTGQGIGDAARGRLSDIRLGYAEQITGGSPAERRVRRANSSMERRRYGVTLDQAQGLIEEGNEDAALNICFEIISRHENPTSGLSTGLEDRFVAMAHAVRGNAYRHRNGDGDVNRARTAYEQSLAMFNRLGIPDDTGHALALFGMVGVLDQLDDRQAIIDVWRQNERAYRLEGLSDEHRWSIIRTVGRAYEAVGDTEPAIRIYTEEARAHYTPEALAAAIELLSGNNSHDEVIRLWNDVTSGRGILSRMMRGDPYMVVVTTPSADGVWEMVGDAYHATGRRAEEIGHYERLRDTTSKGRTARPELVQIAERKLHELIPPPPPTESDAV